MNDSRRKLLLDNQSMLAQKTYEFVPIQDSWSCTDIHRAMTAQSATSSSFSAIRACLGALKDAKIIREPKPGMFQRDADKKTVVQPYERLKQQEGGVTSNGMIIKEDKTFKAVPAKPENLSLALDAQTNTESEEKNMSKEIVLPTCGTVKSAAGSIDALTELAVDLGDFATNISMAIKSFATRIEEVASLVETEQVDSAEKLKKLETLKSLLNGL